MDWCEEKKLVITNTWYETHARRRYIWISSGDRARNQIDCIVINENIRLTFPMQELIQVLT